MRYMGAAAADPMFAGVGRMDPIAKAQIIANAGSIPDDAAQDILDVADATNLGKHEHLMRLGLGALAGVAVGVVVTKLLGR